jgi:hypothetical protein
MLYSLKVWITENVIEWNIYCIEKNEYNFFVILLQYSWNNNIINNNNNSWNNNNLIQIIQIL